MAVYLFRCQFEVILWYTMIVAIWETLRLSRVILDNPVLEGGLGNETDHIQLQGQDVPAA
jgi:hypothetical protein